MNNFATAINYYYCSITKKEYIIQSLVTSRDQYVARGQQCGQLSDETNFNLFIVFNYLFSNQAVLCDIVIAIHLPLN